MPELICSANHLEPAAVAAIMSTLNETDSFMGLPFRIRRITHDRDTQTMAVITSMTPRRNHTQAIFEDEEVWFAEHFFLLQKTVLTHRFSQRHSSHAAEIMPHMTVSNM
jgi:hypothetical protein